MTKSPYVPLAASLVIPAHALASMPQTVPNRVPIFSGSDTTASAGTHEEDATMFSHRVALGVGGRASAASHRPVVTAGQARGWFVAV